MNVEESSYGFREKYEAIHGEFTYNYDLELDRDKTALVIVDLQPAFFDSRYALTKANKEMLPNGTEYFERRVKELALAKNHQLLKHFRNQGRLIVYIVTWSETDDLSDMPIHQKRSIQRWDKIAGEPCYRKWSPGMQVCEELAPLEHELVVPKRTGSAFASSMLPLILRNAGIETVVLTGINTNGCVFETAVVGKNMGFSFLMASDATACFDPWLQEVAETWISRHFAAVRTTDEIVEMLK